MAMKEKSKAPILEKLLLETGQRNTHALEELYDAMHGPVYALALSYLKNAEDAGDVTQDTFLRVWENADRYEPRGKPGAWILTIARNLALMKLREQSRQGELSPEEWEAIPDRKPEVTAEDRVVLQDALSILGDEERRVVLLYAATGLKHREIAGLLGLPLSTVLSKYRRALRKLKAYLEKEGAA